MSSCEDLRLSYHQCRLERIAQEKEQERRMRQKRLQLAQACLRFGHAGKKELSPSDPRFEIYTSISTMAAYLLQSADTTTLDEHTAGKGSTLHTISGRYEAALPRTSQKLNAPIFTLVTPKDELGTLQAIELDTARAGEIGTFGIHTVTLKDSGTIMMTTMKSTSIANQSQLWIFHEDMRELENRMFPKKQVIGIPIIL